MHVFCCCVCSAGFGGSCLTLSSEKRESRGRGQTKASPSSRLSASTSQLAPPSVSKSRPVKDKATTIQEAKGVGGSQVDIRPKMSPLRTAASGKLSYLPTLTPPKKLMEKEIYSCHQPQNKYKTHKKQFSFISTVV